MMDSIELMQFLVLEVKTSRFSLPSIASFLMANMIMKTIALILRTT